VEHAGLNSPSVPLAHRPITSPCSFVEWLQQRKLNKSVYRLNELSFGYCGHSRNELIDTVGPCEEIKQGQYNRVGRDLHMSQVVVNEQLLS